MTFGNSSFWTDNGVKKKTFTLHRIDGYICNLYLAEYKDGLLLLDSGAASDIERIEKLVTGKLGRTMSDIKLVVVSHMHPDHGGGAYLMRERYGIPVAAHGDIDQWYRGLTGIIQHRIDCYMAQMVAKQRKEPKQNIIYRRKLRPDYRLTDGQALPFFEDWKALHVPGHTLHDIVLYHQKTRTLYAADCILNVGGKFNLPIPVFFNGRMRQSLTRLKELDIATILLAHGDMLKPDNTAEIFDTMISLLDRPKNDIQKFYYNVSFFTPEFWRAYLRKRIRTKKG